MTDEAERMQILDMIERGHITPDEGLKLLQALVSGGEEEDELLADREIAAAVAPTPEMRAASAQPAPAFEPQPQELVDRQPSALPADAARWRQFWMIPLWIGVAILVLGGILMVSVLERAGLGFWFVLSAIPFLLGLVIIILAWQSQTAPWIHLRVTQAKGETPEHIAFSFPIPIRPTLWFLRTFGWKIPKLQEISLDKIIMAVDQSAKAENPIYIQVDEGEQGEKVEIYIG